MMNPIPVIAIFDIGKTNKKFFLFDEQYRIVWERSARFEETSDEDGFPCDDIEQLTNWVRAIMTEALALAAFSVKAVNFSAYGASFVHINKHGDPVTPLYNYLKPYPSILQNRLYGAYGGELRLSVETASPVLGSLNSGMQVYRLQQEKKQVFATIWYSLHLPQYISYLVTGNAHAEITSIGCHTNLWDFTKNSYHRWVSETHIIDKFPPVFSSDSVLDIDYNGHALKAGPGLHDSSSALIPYLMSFPEPFILISTGTWCISLNPFNTEPLTNAELAQDCLCYIGYDGRPVKASRLFAGHEHEQVVKQLAEHFNLPVSHYRNVDFKPGCVRYPAMASDPPAALQQSAFAARDLSSFENYDEAYHQFIYDVVRQQKRSTTIVFSDRKITRIFVDGGFGKNPVYMNMLAAAFPGMEIYAASVAQATALGAALAIHRSWNSKTIPGGMIGLEYYCNPCIDSNNDRCY